jgi:hypothetical protein
MAKWAHLLAAEFIKIRRSPALYVIFLLPLLFVFLDYRSFGRGLGIRPLSPQELHVLPYLPLRSLAVLWAGLFHPLLIALLPPLVFKAEHGSKMWKHLFALPISRRQFYLSKATVVLVLNALGLSIVALIMWGQWGILAHFRPQTAFVFPWLEVFKVLGWMYLGSLPLIFSYVWVADRISASAVPIMLGLVGLMLTMALAGQEMDPLWKRDLIPWVLPYTCTQRAIQHEEARQEAHIAAVPLQKEIVRPKMPRIDDSRSKIKVKIISDLEYDGLGLKPPDPTPTWWLITFSLGAGAIILGMGWWDSGRNRE